MTWMQIARAFETGWTPPERKRRPGKGLSEPRYITVAGETKRLSAWANDTRNIHNIGTATLAKRANNPLNLISIETWFRPPVNPVRREG